MSSSNASATKITKKPRGSNGSMVYSLGMKTKKPRGSNGSMVYSLGMNLRTAVKNTNAERTQFADKKKNGASQAREMMKLRQQLAAAEEKLKKKRANEKTLIHMVGELESENAKLVKAQEERKRSDSDSGQLLDDAKKYIAELQTRLVDAMCARDEYEDMHGDDQNQISELKKQLRDALCESYEYEDLRADDQNQICELKKSVRDLLCESYEHEELRANDQNQISELERQLKDARTTIEELKADAKTKAQLPLGDCDLATSQNNAEMKLRKVLATDRGQKILEEEAQRCNVDKQQAMRSMISYVRQEVEHECRKHECMKNVFDKLGKESDGALLTARGLMHMSTMTALTSPQTLALLNKEEKVKKSQVTEYEDQIEQLAEQKSSDSPTASRKFFRYTNDRHRQPMGIDHVIHDETLEYSDDYDYSNEDPTEF